MGLTLQFPPGYSDMQDAVLAANEPALAIEIGRIYENACFGVARCEVFQGSYKNGDTVPLPVSPIDGYEYSRDELTYIWAVHNTVNPNLLWITGKDSLWYANWFVDQTTGQVFSEEWYRKSGSKGETFFTNDGGLWVWTIGQRIKNDLVMAVSPSYAAISPSWIGVNDPLSQQLAQGLNDDAKLSAVNHEVIYMGEFTNAQQVPTAVSPADGYAYGYSEMKFMFSWHWTFGTSTYQAPPMSYGQLGPLECSIDSTGHVSFTEGYIDNSGSLFTVGDGRVAVFAFCTRSSPSSFSSVADLFAEISFSFFIPGAPLRASVVQQILNNIYQALVTPEFFGPTLYTDGQTVSIPTSPVDGYVYSRSELTYIFTYTNTTNASGSNLRMASFFGKIDQSTGHVTLGGYRLPPGGPYVPAVGTDMQISVITVARRQQQAMPIIPDAGTNPQSDFNTVTTDQPVLSTVKYVAAIGTINGSNQAFTLPESGTVIMVFLNGVPRTDFTQSSPPSTSFTTTFVPLGNGTDNDTLTVLYSTQ